MATKSKVEVEPRTSDRAVQAKTGKSWQEWFSILDSHNAAELPHKEIVAILVGRHAEIGGWWQQMVTVAYEQARGLRKVNQRPEGFQISVSRTIAASVSSLFTKWEKPAKRKSWLGNYAITFTTVNQDKSLRGIWEDDGSRLEVLFNEKDNGKTQVVVQQMKLPDSNTADRAKAFWATSLDKLKAVATE